jgi:hypothetical protein
MRPGHSPPTRPRRQRLAPNLARAAGVFETMLPGAGVRWASVRRHLRELPGLRHFRGRHAVVVVCRDDATGWERHRDAFTALEAELVLEPHAGALSAAIGRPAVGRV